MAYIRVDKIFYHPEIVNNWLEKKKVTPITIELHLTNKCNIKCNYCFFKDRHNSDTLSTEDAKMIIDDFVRMGVKGLILSGGGEPTMHKDFKSIVKYAYAVGLDIGLITNGVIYPDVLKYLTWVRFSLDTFDKDIYKKIKGVNKFYQVENNIKKVIRTKLKNEFKVTIGIQMVVTEENYKDIIPMYEYVHICGADYFQFRPLENASYPNYVWKDIFDTLYFFSVNKNKIMVLTTQNKWDEITGTTKKTYKGCPGADLIGAVDAKGDFYMCCHFVQDETAKYGNMIDDTVGEILKNRKNIQDNFDYSKCPIACRASTINTGLDNFKKIEHVNFL